MAAKTQKIVKNAKPAARKAAKPSLMERAQVIASSDTSREFGKAVAMGAGAALGMFAVSSLHAALSN